MVELASAPERARTPRIIDISRCIVTQYRRLDSVNAVEFITRSGRTTVGAIAAAATGLMDMLVWLALAVPLIGTVRHVG